MNKKHLNGVFKLEGRQSTFQVYVRLGVVHVVSDPSIQRFVGQPLKTLIRWMENQEKEIPWETVSIEDAYLDGPTSVGGLAVELGLYPGENQPCDASIVPPTTSDGEPGSDLSTK